MSIAETLTLEFIWWSKQ